MDISMDSITGVPYSPNFLNNLSTNPMVILVLTFVIVLYYSLFASLGDGGQVMDSDGSLLNMEILLWGVFILLVMLNGMSYMFDMDVTASIKNMFSANPEIDIIVDPEDLAGDINGLSSVPEIKISKQVFHVPNNKYAYDDAKAICRAYGGRLATIKEVEDSYNKGADWCGFGWSDGQMALYPTQYDKWAKLQEIKGHEHDCGRPGVNGGYIKNKNVKFGVNCYGYKPQMTKAEQDAMKLSPLYPITKREREFDKKVDYWRGKLGEIAVAPFNHNNWSHL
jgi:hypothetical protein